MFDFRTFERLVAQCYEPGPYTLEEVLSVFKCYFSLYEQKTGHPHPNIKMDQIRRIIQKMPYLTQKEELELRGTGFSGVFPVQYKYIIAQHFQTPYPACDFNINHFFAGRIRELRYRETVRPNPALYAVTQPQPAPPDWR